MKTPRTDAEVEKHGHGSTMRAHCLNSSHLSGDFADFARQLETELQAMTALADKMAEAILQAPYDEPLAEALAAYENHKKGNTP
jgi:hypothetical protein